MIRCLGDLKKAMFVKTIALFCFVFKINKWLSACREQTEWNLCSEASVTIGNSRGYLMMKICLDSRGVTVPWTADWPGDCCEGKRVVAEAASAGDWAWWWRDCCCLPSLRTSSCLWWYSVWRPGGAGWWPLETGADWLVVRQQTLVYICRLREEGGRLQSPLRQTESGMDKTGRGGIIKN